MAGVDGSTGAVFTSSGDTFYGRVLVGADGANSAVGKSISSRRRFGCGLQLAFQTRVPREKIIDEYRSLTPKMFLGYVKEGYAWIFPRKDSFVIGISGKAGREKVLKKVYVDFLSLCTGTDPRLRFFIEAHLIPKGDFVKIPGKGNVLLVGDAAGLVNPLTGEGIYYAHMSAELASRAIIEYYESGKENDLLKLYTQYLTPVHNELRIAKRVSYLVYSPLRKLAFLAVKSPRTYLKVAEVIHGIKSYSQIPLISKGIKSIHQGN